jgi:hypothetical protein
MGMMQVGDSDLAGGEAGGHALDPLDRHLGAVFTLALEDVAEPARRPDAIKL